jgi:hypothetical protein
MQTVIGIVICLIVVIYFVIGFMNTYEGLTTSETTGSTTVKTGTVVANASGAIPLTAVDTTTQADSVGLGNLVGVINNPANVLTYENTINNLLDYYDYQTLNAIANVKPDPTTGVYNLDNIIKYKQTKDALNDSLTFLQSL